MEVESIRLEGLGDLILEAVISKLDPKRAALFTCARTRLRAAASAENLWRIFCARDFAVDSPRDPEGNLCPPSKGCVLDGTYDSSCQLYSRHWIIRAKDVVLSDVIWEAVIGKFPLLLPSEEEFVYESCTQLPDAPGSVEGSFTFVPGRLRKPEGRQFDVKVAVFSLDALEYIF